MCCGDIGLWKHLDYDDIVLIDAALFLPRKSRDMDYIHDLKAKLAEKITTLVVV